MASAGEVRRELLGLPLALRFFFLRKISHVTLHVSLLIIQLVLLISVLQDVRSTDPFMSMATFYNFDFGRQMCST